MLEKGTNRRVSPGMQLQTDAYLFNEGDNQLRCSVLAFTVPPMIAPDPMNFGTAWSELERMYNHQMEMARNMRNPGLKPTSKEHAALNLGAESICLPMLGTDYGFELDYPYANNAQAMAKAVTAGAYLNLKFVDTMTQFVENSEVIAALAEAAREKGLQWLENVQEVVTRGEQFAMIQRYASELTSEAFQKLTEEEKQKVYAMALTAEEEWSDWRKEKAEKERITEAVENV